MYNSLQHSLLFKSTPLRKNITSDIRKKMDYPVNFSNSKDSTETFLNELVKHPAMSAIMNTAKNEE